MLISWVEEYIGLDLGLVADNWRISSKPLSIKLVSFPKMLGPEILVISRFCHLKFSQIRKKSMKLCVLHTLF